MEKKVSIFNTASSGIEHIEPSKGNELKLFVCGPTVQGPIHAGHARTYLLYDMLVRLLNFQGMKVSFVMNITDLEEKIYEAAVKKSVSPEEYAEEQIAGFIADMKELRIGTVTCFERVSMHMKDIIKYIDLLIERGFAYVKEGFVFFDTSKENCFGYLSHLPKEEILLRPLELTEKKRNLHDFSLWRPIKVTSLDLESPWGNGSPGWHIQDTAITLEKFKDGYDIHGGANELIYPHHEAQVTIFKAITGNLSFVKHWLHTNLLKIDGRKMSKSEGNVVTVKDLLNSYSSSKLRFALLSKHYRKDMVYEDIEYGAALYEKVKRGLQYEGSTPSEQLLKIISSDLNTETVISRLEKISVAGSVEEKKEAVAFARTIMGIDFD